MIIQKLYGGLGNQLFQYALGRSLSVRKNTPLVLDISFFQKKSGRNTPRDYELWRYPLKARLANKGEQYWGRALNSKLLRSFSLSMGSWRAIRERGFDFDENILSLSGNLYLDGYWQSPSYFKNIRVELLKDLIPTIEMGEQDKKIADKISCGNAISIHVRRGDYVTNAAAAATHGLCSLEYYKAAAEMLVRECASPHFFVFSDDPEWVKLNLTLPGPSTFVSHNGQETAFQDIRLMSMCQHNIIANSSFSWWGAWLNQSNDKKVIAPKRWFLKQQTPTLLPADWIVLG